MMYKWLEAEDHSVKNFNKIFNLSKILDTPPNKEVTIGDIHVGGLREVFVDNKLFLIELKCSNMKVLTDDVKPDVKLNKNEKVFVETLKSTKNITYSDLKVKLGMTTNVFSKTLTSLKTKQIIIEIGKSLGRNSANKIIKLI